MAQKKAIRRPVKKTSSSKGSSKSKSKPSASTKQKGTIKSTAKGKPAKAKNTTASKVKKKPVSKVKPKSSTSVKKTTSSIKTPKKGSPSAKKKATRQLTKTSKPRTVISKAPPKTSRKQTPKPSPSVKAKSKSPVELSTIDRYNIGGLLACAIDSSGDSGTRRLQKFLKHLALSSQEQENLLRQTQGFMIPRLFAEEIKDDGTRKLAVKTLIDFAKSDGNDERDWRPDVEQIGMWLGIAI